MALSNGLGKLREERNHVTTWADKERAGSVKR